MELCPPIAIQTIYQHYISLTQNHTPTEDFLEGRLVFLPKGKELDDFSGRIQRTPSKTRLLTLSNCDNKSAAALIAFPLNDVARATVHHSQTGVSGRSMATNMVNLESKAIEFMLRRAPGLVFLPLTRLPLSRHCLVNSCSTYCEKWEFPNTFDMLFLTCIGPPRDTFLLAALAPTSFTSVEE